MTNPFPLIPPKTTEQRLGHFDEYAYTGTSNTILYKYVDVLCGSAGAGALINQAFFSRMAQAMETIYFNDLDYIFGKLSFLARSPAESYPYDPMNDQLTSDQWDEVRVKDAWYRARIKDFFVACGLGGTPDGIRMAIQAAVAADCDIYEVWRYKDNFGIIADLGRAPVTARNEVVVRPHKSSLEPAELRLCRDMLDRICSVDTVVTVNLQGLAVLSPVPVAAAAADSEYYEVQKVVTATPALAQLPPPELLPIDLLPTQTWLYSSLGDPTLAPYAAFNITAQYGYYYLVGGGKRSPIDSVTYGTLQPDGSVKTEPNYQVFDTTGQYTDSRPYDRADSPDNYPGGKYGIHPDIEPARNPDGTPYIFTWLSQAAFVAAEVIRIVTLGGLAGPDSYRLPVQTPSSAARTFYPDYAIAYFPPAQESTVTTAITAGRSLATITPDVRNPVNFVRSS